MQTILSEKVKDQAWDEPIWNVFITLGAFVAESR